MDPKTMSMDERLQALRELVETCPQEDASAVASWLSRFGARLWCSYGTADGAVTFERLAGHHARIENRNQMQRAAIAKQQAAQEAAEAARVLCDDSVAGAMARTVAQGLAELAHEEAVSAYDHFLAAEALLRSWHREPEPEPKRRGRRRLTNRTHCIT